MRKRGKDLGKLREVVKILAEGATLQARYRDHALMGTWQPSRDCHIEDDWVLIYTPEPNALRLERTSTHSDLFKE
jgi:mRNA interferase YafQ